MSLSSALSKSIQVKFFDMSVFFIVSLITFRYFEINERGLLSIFWATFFVIELFIFELGATIQAKIPNHLVRKQILDVQNIIISAYFIRSLSACIVGFLVFIFSEQISLTLTPENVDHLRLDFVLKAASIFFALNIFFGPVDHSTLIAFQKYEKMRLFYNVKIAPLLVSAFLTLALKKSPEFMIFSYIIIRFIFQTWVGWYSYFYLIKSKSISFKKIYLDFNALNNVFKHGAPLWISTLLAASTPHIAILILGEYSNLESVAQFSLAMSLFMAAIAFTDMLDGWLVPKLSERKSNDLSNTYDYINNFYNLYFYTSTFICILVIIFSDLAVKIISGDGYENSVSLLIGLCCFMNFRTLMIFRHVIVVFKSTKILPIFVAYKFIVEVISMILLIPLLGFYGILVAQLLSYLVIGQLFIIRVLSKIFNKRNIMKLFFNKYLYMSSISSFFMSILLYLSLVGSSIFYVLSVVYMISILFLIIQKKQSFKKILSL